MRVVVGRQAGKQADGQADRQRRRYEYVCIHVWDVRCRETAQDTCSDGGQMG